MDNLLKNGIIAVLLSSLFLLSCSDSQQQSGRGIERLRVSPANPHLLETVSGKPVFLNNSTIWKLVERGTREDIHDIIDACKKNKYNMISFMVLGIHEWEDRIFEPGLNVYGKHAFERDENGIPDPLRPLTTPGGDPDDENEYDYWDHVEYAIDLAAENGMYVSVHPAWGNWFQGDVHGMREGDITIFDAHTAYQYGIWLGDRFGSKDNVLWMLGGDRSAINDSRTKWYTGDTIQDFRFLYHAMAEGLADGFNGVDQQDGKADYANIAISYHPRKWGPNSSDWFHEAEWLMLNSVQDTPVDIVVAMEKDYRLRPVKPTWLYEGRYEGAIHAWGVRYQAYYSVFAGGTGHTYGSDIWELRGDWHKLLDLPGNLQMAHLYTIVREIWTDEEYLNRVPDQSMILGGQGKIYGRGIYVVEDFESKEDIDHESSEYISGIRCKNGNWAMVYTPDGRDVELDLSVLAGGLRDAYWFNPRNGKWWVEGIENEKMEPFITALKTGESSYLFDAPGEPEPENDWVLILK